MIRSSETTKSQANLPPRSTDADFAKYAREGAYHWKEASNHLRHHQAFTVERYRRTLAAAGELTGLRVLDYGCGDGALLGWISKRVGDSGEAHGFDPNPDAQRLAQQLLEARSLRASVHSALSELSDDHFDVIISAEVMEHVDDLGAYFADMQRLLRPDGKIVLTTPVRLSEEPLDPNHVVEWFPDEWKSVLEATPFELEHHEQFIPVAAPEVYFWRPRWLLRMPVARVLCNLVSILFGVNVLTALDLRPRLFMGQLAVLRRR